MGKNKKYTIIKSFRKSCSITVERDGTVTIRAPFFMSEKKINKIIEERKEWIEKAQKRIANRTERLNSLTPITSDEIDSLKATAKPIIEKKVRFFADEMGVKYGKITIRNQKTRYGSCTAKGNLNFNCLIMLMPEEIIDYVIVHELCHIKEMNHSHRFWKEVESILPDYKERRKWLKQNGNILIERMVKGQNL
ncbi:MAG: M48 family metallopeptidase [Clostridia bacterium]|nr:M48 family metallopeptidase [Clostridia bacterium]